MRSYHKKIVHNKLRYFFFLLPIIALILFLVNSNNYRSIQLSPEQAQIIGNKIWLNEGAGKSENLIIWNKREDFPSLGIGHFIWLPKGANSPFKESFPKLLEHISKKRELPLWLGKADYAPWASREEFIAALQSPQMSELRNLLENTFPIQLEFIIERLERALPDILSTVHNQQAKDRIEAQFYKVAKHKNGLYALIDYVNFKGEGTSLKERYNNQGWGLLQVLENMNPNSELVMEEFVRAADFALTRRVENAKNDESHWLPGWRKRLSTYLL